MKVTRSRAAGIVVALTIAVAAAATWQAVARRSEAQVNASTAQVSIGKRVAPSADRPVAGFGTGGFWSPDVDPIGGKEVSLSAAQSESGYPIYAPSSNLTSDSSLSHVWMGTEPPGGDSMLPTYAQTTVALSYSSGVQVTFIPWVYGVDAPTFSQTSNEQAYKLAASQLSTISVDSLDGTPVRMMAYESGAESPGWVEFNLGTSNADALDITVLGKLNSSDLESVSRSIIDQWLAANQKSASVG